MKIVLHSLAEALDPMILMMLLMNLILIVVLFWMLMNYGPGYYDI
jgi:hypothetical protein